MKELLTVVNGMERTLDSLSDRYEPIPPQPTYLGGVPVDEATVRLSGQDRTVLLERSVLAMPVLVSDFSCLLTDVTSSPRLSPRSFKCVSSLLS